MVILDYLRALLFDWRKKRAISEARPVSYTHLTLPTN